MAGTTDWLVARKKATTWGTAVAVGALDGVKITSETFPAGIPDPIKDDNVGDVLSGGTFQGDISVEGNVVIPVRFEGIENDLALFMGAAGVPTTVEAALAFLHTMPFKSNSDGIFATWAIDKGLGTVDSSPNEIETAKYGSIEFGFDAGKAMLTCGLIANKIERASPVNGATEFGLVTNPTDGLLAVFSASTFRLTEVTGSEGNLTATEDLLVSEARVTANRNISGDHVTGSNGEIDEPATDGLPEAQLIVTFPQLLTAVDNLIKDAVALQADRQPKVYKAQLFVTGGLITGSVINSYFFYFDLPALTLANAPQNAGGPGAKVPVEMTFDILTPQAATLPNGTDWSWATAGGDPFRARVQNGRATDPLA